MSGPEITGLLLAAAAGGAINAVAGGGTLVTFPTLLFFGMQPIAANATSTFALVLGTSGSIYGYRRYIPEARVWLKRFMPVSIAGSLLGSMLLTRTSNATFSKLVPFLILFATLLFFSQTVVQRRVRERQLQPELLSRTSLWVALAFQFLVAVYGGYFGAGIGILMLASLGLLGFSDIHQMNTVKNILGGLINLVAAIYFVFFGLVHWREALIMTIGAVAGYFLGAHYSQRISQVAVKRLVTLVGFTLAGVTFYKQFLR
jgi:uncharacterized membrane protein YfcA